MTRTLSRLLDFFLVSCLIVAPLAKAQWDPNFGVPGVDLEVDAVITHGDEIYIAGYFGSAGGVTATNVAKWTGTNWMPLGPGVGRYDTNYLFSFASETRSLAFFRGDLYVGGFFTNAGQVAARNLAKWDGTNWSQVGGGTPGPVFELCATESALYVGGRFQMPSSGITNIAKWDGSSWSPLGTGVWRVGPDQNAFIHALAVDGANLYAGGLFNFAGGVNATNVARWDGTRWWALQGGVNAEVYALANGADGIYAGGNFRRAGSIYSTNVARWNGTNWFSLQSGVHDLAPVSVTSIVRNGRDVYIAGGFTGIGGITAKGIARWDGAQWSGLGEGPSGPLALACTGSELFVGGFFSTAGGIPSTNIALWHIPHALRASRIGTNVMLSWPVTGSNFALESTQSLAGSNWNQIPKTPLLEGDSLAVTNPITSGNEFFRLRRK